MTLKFIITAASTIMERKINEKLRYEDFKIAFESYDSRRPDPEKNYERRMKS